MSQDWDLVAKGTRFTQEFATFLKRLPGSHPISSQSLAEHYSLDGRQLQEQYKDHLRDYHKWDQKSHADHWLLYEQNIGGFLSIDETSLSNGELYYHRTNKAAKGRKGAIVAWIKAQRQMIL